MAFDSLWLLGTLVPFVIRYGMVAREEAYLEGKFGDAITTTAPACGAGCSAW
jgi:protein-S-isoprenylcysteine O-methyltransferase Ste14